MLSIIFFIHTFFSFITTKYFVSLAPFHFNSLFLPLFLLSLTHFFFLDAFFICLFLSLFFLAPTSLYLSYHLLFIFFSSLSPPAVCLHYYLSSISLTLRVSSPLSSRRWVCRTFFIFFSFYHCLLLTLFIFLIIFFSFLSLLSLFSLFNLSYFAGIFATVFPAMGMSNLSKVRATRSRFWLSCIP